MRLLMRQIHKVDQSIKIIVMFWNIRKQRTILVGVYYLSLWSMILMRSIDINGYSFYLSFHGSPLGNSYGDFLYRFILYIWVTVTLYLNCVYNYLFYRTILSLIYIYPEKKYKFKTFYWGTLSSIFWHASIDKWGKMQWGVYPTFPIIT